MALRREFTARDSGSGNVIGVGLEDVTDSIDAVCEAGTIRNLDVESGSRHHFQYQPSVLAIDDDVDTQKSQRLPRILKHRDAECRENLGQSIDVAQGQSYVPIVPEKSAKFTPITAR